jgi:hypothetical protein
MDSYSGIYEPNVVTYCLKLKDESTEKRERENDSYVYTKSRKKMNTALKKPLFFYKNNI